MESPGFAQREGQRTIAGTARALLTRYTSRPYKADPAVPAGQAYAHRMQFYARNQSSFSTPRSSSSALRMA